MGALMPVQRAAGAIGGSSAGVGFGGGISGMVNPVNSFQPSANASSGGTRAYPVVWALQSRAAWLASRGAAQAVTSVHIHPPPRRRLLTVLWVGKA
jgi:hypothetical protein